MATISTRRLKDRLSSYLHRAEAGERVVVLRDGKPVAALVSVEDAGALDEEARLAALAARGVVTLPRRRDEKAFTGRPVPARGKPASAMVIEDRR
jgi:prevent-host-death family protein